MADKTPESRKSSGLIQGLTAKQRFIDQLELEASMEGAADDGQSIADLIIERMQAATNLDELFDAQDVSLPSGKSLVDSELMIRDFTVRKSDPQYSENSIGYYYVIDAADADTGEDVRFATGALNILSLLMALRVRGDLPIRVAIRGKSTPNGTLLLMRRVGPRTSSQK